MMAVAQRFGGPATGVEAEAEEDDERDERAMGSPCS